jgi:phosphoserine aminotransferase
MDDAFRRNLLNFSAGPGALPYTVLTRAQKALMNAPGLGSSILGVSHRSSWFSQLVYDTEQMLRLLMRIPENYHVVFLQGGSSLLFSMIPMNFHDQEFASPEYVLGGYWSKRATKEASMVTECKVLWDGEARGRGYRWLPSLDLLAPHSGSAYMHYVSNETVEGTQFGVSPPASAVPIIADMSSDFLSRRIDVSKFGMIYAHAQKNLGPAGVTVAIIRDDLAQRCPDTLPEMLNFRTHIDHSSAFNTPNVFGIYVMSEMLRWIADSVGGVDRMHELNQAKAMRMYETLDAHREHVEVFAYREVRSTMNVSFKFKRAGLDQAFLDKLAPMGFSGLEGHRSVGGLRVSMYNAVEFSAVAELCNQLDGFVRQHA